MIPSLPIITIACLVAGYIFIRSIKPFYYSIVRNPPFILYLSIAAVSIGLFSVSTIIYIFISWLGIANSFATEFHTTYKIISKVYGNPSLVAIIMISFIVGLLVWFIYWATHHTAESKLKILEKVARKSPFEKIIFTALQQKELICFTLKNGKVYIGYINEYEILSEVERTHIVIIPLLSGYRDSETHKITITTEYIYAIRKMISNINDKKDELEKTIKSFAKIIPCSEILTINLYDTLFSEKDFIKPKPGKRDN
jgi:hypothetical protein